MLDLSPSLTTDPDSLRRAQIDTARRIDNHTYKYTPLHPNLPSFRLLKLHPHKDGGEPGLVCELTLAYLGEGVKKYEAISYHWGTRGDMNNELIRIELDQKSFFISETVHDILKALQANKPRRLWIDFICIDQGNLDERSIQVTRMKEIFGHATSVIISLGPHGGQPASALSPSQRRGFLPRFRTSRGPTNQARRLLSDLRHPWFSRIWVVQEVAAARNLRLLSSGRWLSMGTIQAQVDDVIRGPTMAGDRRYSYFRNIDTGLRNDLEVALKPCQSLFDIMMSFPNSEFDLLPLLEKFRHFNATDPRDKVYALLGISKEVDAVELKPDYALSIAEVYTRTSKYFMRRYSNLSALSYVGISSPEDDFSDPESRQQTGQARSETTLPSWCPDWRLKALHIKQKGPSPNCQPRGADDPCSARQLVIRGFSIAKVFSIFPDGNIESAHVSGQSPGGSDWPFEQLSIYLTKCFKDKTRTPKSLLKEGDLLCLLLDTSGLAVLRPFDDFVFKLVKLAHSEFSEFQSGDAVSYPGRVRASSGRRAAEIRAILGIFVGDAKPPLRSYRIV